MQEEEEWRCLLGEWQDDGVSDTSVNHGKNGFSSGALEEIILFIPQSEEPNIWSTCEDFAI